MSYLKIDRHPHYGNVEAVSLVTSRAGEDVTLELDDDDVLALIFAAERLENGRQTHRLDNRTTLTQASRYSTAENAPESKLKARLVIDMGSGWWRPYLTYERNPNEPLRRPSAHLERADGTRFELTREDLEAIREAAETRRFTYSSGELGTAVMQRISRNSRLSKAIQRIGEYAQLEATGAAED